MKVRVELFKSEFSEFSKFEDDDIRSLIRLYDQNLRAARKRSDVTLQTFGGLMLVVGWLFFNGTSVEDLILLEPD